ncbi:hypothetical protein CH252_19020 [Rhodococcus sp. 06-1477-1B]|nr:hypothetical protein CH252_19020 [Rhodococcus sp. 06-1477-1B]
MSDDLRALIQRTLEELAPSVAFLPGYDDIADALVNAIHKAYPGPVAIATSALAEAVEKTVKEHPEPHATDSRMVGSPLDITKDPAHRATHDRWHTKRQVFERPEYRDGPRHVIVGDRQEGKTTLAKKWLLEAPADVERVLVTYSLDDAAGIKEDLGLTRNDPRVISFHSLIGPGRSARPDVEYGFDETVRILERLLRLKQPPHLLTIVTASAWQGDQR